MTAEKTNPIVTQLAQALGEAPEAIMATNPRWLTLMKEGVVVNLTLRRWRAKVSLSFEDLGLPVTQLERSESNKVMTLGEKFLLPRRYMKRLASIDSAARTNLARHGYKTHWGYFVPVTAYEAFKESNESYIAEYLGLRDEIVENWQSIRVEMVEDYSVEARKAYRRIGKLDVAKMSLAEYANEDRFVDRFVAQALAYMPTPEQFAESFAYETRLEYIPLPSQLAEEQAEAERIRLRSRANRELEAEEALLESAKLQAERAKVYDETAAERERVSSLRAMNDDIVAKARQEKEQLVERFMADVFGQLRSLVFEAVTDVAATIERNRATDGTIRLHPRSVTQLQNLLDKVEQLNFIGDQEITKVLQPVKAVLQQAPGTRNAKEFRQALEDIAIVTRQSLLAVGQDTSRMSRAALPPAAYRADRVRNARQNLGLDEIAPLESQPMQRRKRAQLELTEDVAI